MHSGRARERCTALRNRGKSARSLLGKRAAIHRVCVRTKKVRRYPCACAFVRVYTHPSECGCRGLCKRHICAYISAGAGGRVHTHTHAGEVT